ncbi:hypothetical protein C8F04DRAFT_1067428 [Mycena alexandri]|uniref:Uncharacterized protein n=1 Tax=Mycena alexandri TaxID=1745969 RepID=A0AAD6TIT8_9AGAR|nr:hypothetical protein C8F04DRAFT_1067428 [Mycena alexandri]
MDIFLPIELQREIFELAVRANHKNAELKLNLSLVAPHVSLCQTSWIFFHDCEKSGHRTTAAGRTSSWHTDCVPWSRVACVVGTIYWGQIPDFPHLVNRLPLRRLSVKYFHLATSIAFDPRPTWLCSLTHLDMAFVKPLMFIADGPKLVDTLKHLHRLTHLALHFLLHPSTVSAVSANCLGLQILVIIFDWSIPASAAKRYSFDHRIVVANRLSSSSSDDWEAAHFGLSNVWTRAESVVAERRMLAAELQADDTK